MLHRKDCRKLDSESTPEEIGDTPQVAETIEPLFDPLTFDRASMDAQHAFEDMSQRL